MHTTTSAWRLALVAAFALLLGPWASAQERAGSRADRAESSASILSLPTTFEAAPPVSASFMADVLNETFTATFTGGPPAAPPGWIQLRRGSTSATPDWVRYTATPCSVANPCTRSQFFDSGSNGRYLVTPQVTPTEAGGNILTFKVGRQYTGYGSTLRIAVSTTTPTIAAFDDPDATIRTLTEADIAGGSFGSITVDLSEFNDTPIYIAFVHELPGDDNTLWLDDVRIAEPVPASYTSSAAAFQGTASNPGGIARGEERWVLGGNVVIGGTVGSLEATSITFATTGTTDVSDLASARVLFLGASTTFNYQTTPQYGSPVLNPDGTMTFTGSQALLPGNNYFLLVYTASATAQAGNVVDATFESVTVGGVARTPSPTTLAGSLPIVTRAPNDNLANATVIWSGSYTGTGTNVNGSAEPGETLPTCGNGTTSSAASSWWSYTPATSGTVTINLAGSSFDTVLSVWTGTTFPLTHVACNDDNPSPSSAQSILTNLPVTGGTTYYIRVGGYNNATGNISISLNGPAPTPPFTFERPTAGQTFKIGNPLKPIWDSHPDFVSSNVVAELCLDDSCTLLYSGPNLQKPNFALARLIIPAGTPSSDEYIVRVCVEGTSTCAESGEFTIYDVNEVIVITGPAQVASGAESTITWTSPDGLPATDVVISVGSRDGSTTYASMTTANDGSETVALPAIPNGAYRLTICPENGPARYCGSSVVRVRPAVVTSPAEGTVLTAGGTTTVTWSAAACASGTATADILLRRASGGKVRLADDTACDGSEEVTIPSGTADGSDYFIQVQIWDGESRVVVGNGATVSVGAAHAAPVAGTSRVAAPMVSDVADAFVRVVAPELADGTEIAVSADALVVGTGVVRNGVAEVALYGAVADPSLVESGLTVEEAMEYIAAGTELTITTWDATGAVAFEIGRVTDASGRTVEALTFEYGSELDVMAKGATASAASATFTLDRISPNPTSGTATVRFSLGEAQAARVAVYDLLGREVATLFDGVASAGATEVRVPALTAGVYVVRVSTAEASATSRFTVVR